MPSKILKTVDFIKADGGLKPATGRIIKETNLEIYIDGRHFSTALILGNKEKDYVYGLLFTHGVIHRADEVKSVTLKRHRADVILARRNPSYPPEIPSGFTVKRRDVFRCVESILKSEVFTETEAVHSAGLFLEGKKRIAIAEDIGRHNALDKVIGRGLINGVDFTHTLAASTGRQPAEMLKKCLASGIPIIATKGVPTDEAVEMAEIAGITIVGLVRGDTMVIYSHPERIA